MVFIAILVSCNESKNSNEQSTADNRTSATGELPKEQKSSASNQGAATDNSIIGEWFQEYAVIDQNGNAVLDPEDRKGTKSSMGFNYFKFNEDGSCLRDSDVKFKGNYEIIEEHGKRKLNVTVNGFGETYKYTIVDPVTTELILYSTGVFMIYNRK